MRTSSRWRLIFTIRQVWKQYGWSPINDPNYRRRFEARVKAGCIPQPRRESLADLDGYLAAVLNRARRFHEALDAVLTSLHRLACWPLAATVKKRSMHRSSCATQRALAGSR